MGRVNIEDNEVTGGSGGVFKVVGKPEHWHEINIRRNRQFMHNGHLVDFFEREPTILEQWGFPADTNPEQVTDLLLAIRDKDPSDSREFIQSSSLARKLLSLETYGNLAQIASFILQVAAIPSVQQYLASLK